MRLDRRWYLRLGFALASGSFVAVAVGGCDEGGGGSCADPGGTDATTVDYETEVQVIFNANCLCHLQDPMGEMTAPLLTLNPGTSLGELVEADAQEAEMLRIEPGCRDNSYLWHKINGTQDSVGGAGMQMPPGGQLTDAELETIGRWISSGAGA